MHHHYKFSLILNRQLGILVELQLQPIKLFLDLFEFAEVVVLKVNRVNTQNRQRSFSSEVVSVVPSFQESSFYGL